MKRRTAMKNIAAIGAAIGIVPSVLGSDSDDDKWVLMDGDVKMGTFLNGEPEIHLSKYIDGFKSWHFRGELKFAKFDSIYNHFHRGGSLLLKKGNRQGDCFISNTLTSPYGQYEITVEGIGPLVQ